MLKKLKYDEFASQLEFAFKGSMDVKLPIFKGITSLEKLEDYYSISPLDHIRSSKTEKEHSNAYNLLLNNLPAWSSLPRREKSIITTSNINTARSFALQHTTNGKVFIVLPQIDASIAVAPKSDIWYSFRPALAQFSLRGLNISLIDFNSALRELFIAFNLSSICTSDWNTFMKDLSTISYNDRIPTSVSIQANSVFNVLQKNKGDLFTFIDAAFNPLANQFKLEKWNFQLSRHSYNDNEIWTSSPCLLISEEKYNGFIKLHNAVNNLRRREFRKNYR